VRVLAIVAALLAAAPAAAQFSSVRYLCDRGVEIPVTYATTDDFAIVVLFVEGGLVTLHNEPAASGVRYAWPSGGSGYVWLTKGDEATLLWRDGAEGTETAVYDSCRA